MDRHKWSAIKEIIKAQHFVVITPKSQIASTPRNGHIKFWAFLTEMFESTKRQSIERVINED